MTFNIDNLREQIPLYVNGMLNKQEKDAFEERIEHFPDLKKELSEFMEIKLTYNEMKNDLPKPPKHLFHRIKNQVKYDQKFAAINRNQEKSENRLRYFFSRWFSSPRLSWSLVAVQLVIIFMLAVNLPNNNRFTTLTFTTSQKTDTVKLNVVFKPNITEQDVRTLLNSVGANIIYGPSQEGLYTLEIAKNDAIDQVIESLQNNESVKFVQRTINSE